MDIRKQIIERMSMSANKLAKLTKLPSRTVYDFVKGSSINLKALGAILDALNLSIEWKGEIPYLQRQIEELKRENKRLEELVPKPWNPLEDKTPPWRKKRDGVVEPSASVSYSSRMRTPAAYDTKPDVPPT